MKGGNVMIMPGFTAEASSVQDETALQRLVY